MRDPQDDCFTTTLHPVFMDDLCQEVISTSKPIKDVATAYGVGPAGTARPEVRGRERPGRSGRTIGPDPGSADRSARQVARCTSTVVCSAPSCTESHACRSS